MLNVFPIMLDVQVLLYVLLKNKSNRCSTNDILFNLFKVVTSTLTII